MVRSVRGHKEAKWCVILEAIALMSSFIPTPLLFTIPYQCHTAIPAPLFTIQYNHPSPLLPIYYSQTYETKFYLTHSLVLRSTKHTTKFWNKGRDPLFMSDYFFGSLPRNQPILAKNILPLTIWSIGTKIEHIQDMF